MMTKGEFRAKKTVSESKLRHVRFGMIYSIQAGVFGYIIFLLVFLFGHKDEPRAPLFFELGFCLVLLISSGFVYSMFVRRVLRWGVFCPSCRQLICDELSADIALETCKCRFCGKPVIEESGEALQD